MHAHWPILGTDGRYQLHSGKCRVRRLLSCFVWFETKLLITFRANKKGQKHKKPLCSSFSLDRLGKKLKSKTTRITCYASSEKNMFTYCLNM